MDKKDQRQQQLLLKKRNSIIISSPTRKSNIQLLSPEKGSPSKNMQIIKRTSTINASEFNPDTYTNHISTSKDVITAKMLFDYICDDDYHEILPQDIKRQFINCGHKYPPLYTP